MPENPFLTKDRVNAAHCALGPESPYISIQTSDGDCSWNGLGIRYEEEKDDDDTDAFGDTTFVPGPYSGTLLKHDDGTVSFQEHQPELTTWLACVDRHRTVELRWLEPMSPEEQIKTLKEDSEKHKCSIVSLAAEKI